MEDRDGFDKNECLFGGGGGVCWLMVSFFESSSIPKKVTYKLNFIKFHKVANYRVRLFRHLSK